METERETEMETEREAERENERERERQARLPVSERGNPPTLSSMRWSNVRHPTVGR